ncbi:unnamed protein product, partial [Symbiodinium microadriaticum]
MDNTQYWRLFHLPILKGLWYRITQAYTWDQSIMRFCRMLSYGIVCQLQLQQAQRHRAARKIQAQLRQWKAQRVRASLAEACANIVLAPAPAPDRSRLKVDRARISLQQFQREWFSTREREEQQHLIEELAAADKEGGYAAAVQLLERRAPSLAAGPLSRAHLELAERAKRGSSIKQVKRHMALALQAQPKAVQ